MLFIAPVFHLSAQNAFLQLFHPQYQELTPLITDSLFVRVRNPQVGEITRAIGIKHPEDMPPSWTEVRSQEKPLELCRLNLYTEKADNRQVTYSDFIDSLKSDTLRSRMTTFGNEPAQPDSILDEIWRKGEWEPVQKSIFTYIGPKILGQRLDMEWNAASGLWENVQITTYLYDGQKRMTQREEQNWFGDDWSLQHTYKYAYRQNENKPKYLVWYAAKMPIDSTVTWYDFQGQEDSSKVYQWNTTQSSWGQQSRRILNNEAAKMALAGNTYTAVDASTNDWLPKEQREFVAGEGVFTDEPQEELLRSFNTSSGKWQDKWRRSIEYQPLTDGRIYGTIRLSELGSDANWSETFFAEGWFHLAPDSLKMDPAKDRSETFTFSYTCGLYNPYVQNQTLSFPATEATGDYELKIFGEEGRLVFQQRYNSNGLATVSAHLMPGVYIVSVSRGGVPLCTQKLIAN